jgi:hypothetical protein
MLFMKKTNLPAMAALCAAVLFGGIFLGIYVPAHLSDSDYEIVLPKDKEEDPVVQKTDFSQQPMQTTTDISITVNNVQDVIRSLDRPVIYSLYVQSTLYYDNSSTNRVCRQYVKNEYSRVDDYGSGTGIKACSIFGKSGYYTWKYGDSTYYHAAQPQGRADMLAMLPTYEEVLKLKPEEITEAKIKNLNYEPCIQISAKKNAQYSYTYVISTQTGLLAQATYYKNGEKIREVTTSGFSEDVPDDSFFELPDGTSIFAN